MGQRRDPVSSFLVVGHADPHHDFNFIELNRLHGEYASDRTWSAKLLHSLIRSLQAKPCADSFAGGTTGTAPHEFTEVLLYDHHAEA